jgi:hypothetical protein
MSRSEWRTISYDSHLRVLSDNDVLDFLARARQRLAAAAPVDDGPAPAEAHAFTGALVALELEAARRGLERPAPHERMPASAVLDRLSGLSPIENSERWIQLLAELDLPGVWRVYLYTQEQLGGRDRLAALSFVAAALDRIVYGDEAARVRWLKHVELPATDEDRLARLNAALEATFGRIFDRMIGADPES